MLPRQNKRLQHRKQRSRERSVSGEMNSAAQGPARKARDSAEDGGPRISLFNLGRMLIHRPSQKAQEQQTSGRPYPSGVSVVVSQPAMHPRAILCNCERQERCFSFEYTPRNPQQSLLAISGHCNTRPLLFPCGTTGDSEQTVHVGPRERASARYGAARGRGVGKVRLAFDKVPSQIILGLICGVRCCSAKNRVNGWRRALPLAAAENVDGDKLRLGLGKLVSRSPCPS